MTDDDTLAALEFTARCDTEFRTCPDHDHDHPAGFTKGADGRLMCTQPATRAYRVHPFAGECSPTDSPPILVCDEHQPMIVELAERTARQWRGQRCARCGVLVVNGKSIMVELEMPGTAK